VRVTASAPGELNLADNDYLDLARDPAVGEAAAAAARVRTSSSASPLITGWREEHERLTADLCAWHGLPHGLIWNSGYTANAAVLGNLPREGDRAFADRLIHNSMIAGLLRSGASLRRYPHLDLDRLEAWLEESPDKRVGPAFAEASEGKDNALHLLFVVTESVFSMDGDYPDLARLVALKRRHGFCLILDEAHALGWYGPEGAGLARAAGIVDAVDVLVGTLGKTLASGGAYTLFRDEAVRDYLTNFAGEFIYSTALPPANAAAAAAAIVRVRELAPEQPRWHAQSRSFRSALRTAGWSAPDGDSPVVPVRLDGEEAALSASAHLSAAGIRVAAVRPPTVPAGTSRLRISLKRTFGAEEQERVIGALAQWRDKR
jgi:8-amino-7-oxononanoate synthase